MIPINILSKMDIYELEISKGDKVKVSVVDNAALIEDKISELRFMLMKPIVGFDVKFHTDDQNQRETAKLLILCVEDCGLIIQLDQLDSVPECLKQFLADESICFVSIGMDKKVTSIQRLCLSCLTGVDLNDFAARVLKNPEICKCSIEDLCRELGSDTVTVTGLPERTPDWSARIFKDEEIKYAILRARQCYLIGYELLDKLKL